ncbi:MAG: zinc ABC transporter substrate-binding protein, partial [Spirochaetaceae bacterium]|nr:zinc ABC transporter substrate-binding protein [Spirochaetaceae bacterium]
MKRAFLAAILMATLSVSVLATPHVVATHAVFAEIASIVGGGQIEVTVIIPSGFCPGHYDLSPSDYAALINADLVLYSGFEPWVEQLGDRTKEGALVQLAGPWNTPAAAAQQTTAISDLLSERILGAANTFAANLDAYLEELDAVESSLSERAAALGVSCTPVVC